MDAFYLALPIAGLALALGAYWLARVLKIYAVVDLVWSLGILLGTWAIALRSGMDHLRDGFVLVAVSFWALRLSYHLLRDRVMPRREDPRYANLMARWGVHAPRNFCFLFLTQLPLVALFLVPISVALGNHEALGWVDAIAVVLAVLALVGEAVADHQLGSFRARPENAGGVCREGLWRYSRHPNYFFEWLYWWTYVLFSVGSVAFGWSLLGPLVMYVFLRYISGVPPAEFSSLKRRGAAYADYQASTSVFFPWKPKMIKTNKNEI
jgi:steroid 5-alpha reductase family enzyme